MKLINSIFNWLRISRNSYNVRLKQEENET